MEVMGVSAMVHRGVCYADEEHLARRLAPELRAALDRGDAVAAALDDPTRAAVTDALGPAAGEVDFVDTSRPARIDAFQLVARRAALVQRRARAGQGSTFVGQNQPHLGLGDDYWLRLEAALQVALADLPVTLLCPYPQENEAAALRAVHGEIVETDGASHANPEVRDPADVALAAAAPPLPELGAPDVTLTATPSTLGDLRRRLVALLDEAGAPPDPDLVYAVSEVATNSVEHGEGRGTVAVWARAATADEPASVVCEVTDTGLLHDPFPGVRPPRLDQIRGRGLWLARTLCEAVDVRVDATGTRVRLTAAPEPED